MPQSLPLNLQTWDIELDAYGNMSLEAEPASIAQDVACAIRTFQGECRYDQTLGMPYFQSILGKLPAGSFVVAAIQQQAFTIPLVDKCTVPRLFLDKTTRKLSGLAVITTTGSTSNSVVGF